MEHGHDTAHLIRFVLNTGKDAIEVLYAAVFDELNFLPRSPAPVFPAACEEVHELGFGFVYQFTYRGVQRTPEIKVEKSARRIVGHQQPVGLVDDDNRVSDAVYYCFGVPFLLAGKLKLDLQVAGLLFQFDAALRVSVETTANRMVQPVRQQALAQNEARVGLSAISGPL
jgi:hypothetical protein